MTTETSPARPPLYRLLWLIVILSLALNLVFLTIFFQVRARTAQELEAILAVMGDTGAENIEVPIHVNEMMPLEMTVSFSETFQIPVSDTIPISASIPFEDVVEVPINTTIAIDNSLEVAVDIPFVGQVPVPIPIVTTIPVNLTVDVPISREVPIQLDIPVNLLIDVPIQTEIPIKDDIPVVLDFPVTVPLSETSYATLLARIEEGLKALAGYVGADIAE